MAGAVVNLVIDLILIKSVGLFAAALSTYAGFLVMWIVRMYDIRKDWPIKVKKVKFIALTMLSTFVATVTIWTSIKIDAVITVIFGILFCVLNKDYIVLILKKLGKR